MSDDEIGPDGHTTLVGRARELEAIATAMTTARRRTARVVQLVGEAGIGKTALAEQAAALVAGQGWTVVWGRAWGVEAAPPYWIWQQVLGSLARTTGVALPSSHLCRHSGEASPSSSPRSAPSEADR